MATLSSNATKPPELPWKADDLPPFPAVALKALNLIGGRDTSLVDLCNLIRSDPAFSTAILKIANSPLVAFSRNITSVLQASMLLGFQRLRSVVITVGLKAYLRDKFAPPLRSCWRHSVACAMVAEQTARWSALDKDFAYTAGIMHDIGRIAMASAVPELYARVLKVGVDHPQDMLRTEQELCGIDHCQAGRSLVAAWGLPDAFLQVTLCHHDPGTEGRGAISVLRPSCLLADSLGLAAVEYRALGSYMDILAEFPESARSHFPADAKELATQIQNEIDIIESA